MVHNGTDNGLRLDEAAIASYRNQASGPWCGKRHVIQLSIRRYRKPSCTVMNGLISLIRKVKCFRVFFINSGDLINKITARHKTV